MNKKPRYRKEDHAMPLYISICIEFYNGITRFSYIIIHQRPFKCWNYTQYADFHGRDVRHGDSRKSRPTTGKSHDDREYCDYFTALRNVTTSGHNYVH